MGPQVNRKAANGDQDHNSEVTKVTVAFWAKRLKTKGFHRKEENVSMGQAQVAATVALSQKPNFAFPCRIFRPAATPHWMDATDFSFNNFQALSRPQKLFLRASFPHQRFDA
jgi:hypothetical protein